MLNLFNLLSDEDKRLIEQYIYRYGVGEADFIGLEEYLKYWAESKKKLYKIFGNKFQVEIPYTYEKSEKDLQKDIEELKNEPFYEAFSNFIDSIFIDLEERINIRYCLHSLAALHDNKTLGVIKFTSPKTGKVIKITAGAKPMRVYAKFAEHFGEKADFFNDYFEDFRVHHSMCFNDKTLTGTLVLSIHPLDFITMSDNNSGWSSCMSWTGNGCYHIGTVEMMNSNNVICAYLKSKEDWCFEKANANKKDMSLVWNNKKWRQLFYVTKDIIVSGKPYPYVKKEMTITCLDKIKELAFANANWDYKYGPEQYRDMIHVNDICDMNKNKEWLNYGESNKHNILFDTKGMYNDMLNDSNTVYWCYRNKVSKMRIISYSGKAPCACCGNDVLEENDYYEDYNDRYTDPENVVCSDCFSEGVCDECNSFVGKKTLTSIVNSFETIKLCPNCASELKRVCPCCGKDYIVIHSYRKNELPALKISNDKIYTTDFSIFNNYYYSIKNHIHFRKFHADNPNNVITPFVNMKVVPAFLCSDCLAKDIDSDNGIFTWEKIESKNEWYISPPQLKIVSRKVYTVEEIENNPKLYSMMIANLKLSIEND